MALDNAVTKKIKASAMKETRSPLPSSSYRLTDNTSRLNRSRFARFFTHSPLAVPTPVDVAERRSNRIVRFEFWSRQMP